jgi:hypothetical protein
LQSLTIFSIKEGKISKDNWEDIILNDWELHAKCNVESFTLRGDREGTEKEKAAIKAVRAKQLEVVGRTYIIPDGYDVERLFASLASEFFLDAYCAPIIAHSCFFLKAFLGLS